MLTVSFIVQMEKNEWGNKVTQVSDKTESELLPSLQLLYYFQWPEARNIQPGIVPPRCSLGLHSAHISWYLAGVTVSD